MFLKRLKKVFSDVAQEEAWLFDNRLQGSSNFLQPQFHVFAEAFNMETVEDTILPDSSVSAPSLKHGLERIVRTEGIYPAHQFPEIVRKLPPILPEVHKRFTTYIRPSKDSELQKLTIKHNAKYFTGSSSLTDSLQQIYYALTNYKSPDITGLGEGFNHLTMNYMSSYRKPNTFFLRKHESGAYSVENDKGPVVHSAVEVLLMGGTILENLFTTDEEDFKKIIDMSVDLSSEYKEQILEASRSYRYRKIGKLVVRSQIDCQGIDSEGKSFVYEIKTRACAPIRYDLDNYKDYFDYQILRRRGVDQSYEREYFDLIRSILIKYFFQIKIGRMDGAAVAYHNTQETFGFEYISLKEIEKRLFGCSEISDQIMKICLCLFQDILDEVTQKFPNDDFLKIGLFANYLSNELMITIEDHKSEFEYPTKPEELKYIKSELDYYNRYFPGKTAYVMCRKIFPYINGILQKEPVFLEPGDDFSFRQIKYAKGVMKFQEYMYFLMHAYKMESFTIHNEFKGIWKKYNDFHVYRKPIYNSAH